MAHQNNHIILPAEWHNQSAVQLTWPHKATDWSPYLKKATECFFAIANTISLYQKVIIVTPDTYSIKQLFNNHPNLNISFIEANTNDTWARDHGGITIIKNNSLEILDFQFNGWGLKFAANFDNKITSTLFQKNIFKKNVTYRNLLNFAFEGGSIESDGEGTILTTTECLLSDNRNGIDKKEAIEDIFHSLFGTERVLWLDHGFLAGDDTDSHIDTLARFCTTDTIAYVSCDDETDEHFEELQKMKTQLETFKTKEGEPYNLVALPMAKPVYDGEDRLPATYANFLIINSAVLVPIYATELDSIALEVIQKIFPDRKVIGIDCNILIQQHGSLHCVTMQYPEGTID